MSIAYAQATVYGTFNGNPSLSLGSTPTPGNYMVYFAAGNDNGVKPAGFTTWIADSTPPNSAVYASYRLVQSGDTAGPYAYTGIGAGYDTLACLMELSGTGVLSGAAYIEGDETYTAAGKTQASPTGSVATCTTGWTFALYNVGSLGALIATAADTANQSFTLDNSWSSKISADGGYNALFHRVESSVTTANPTCTYAALIPSGNSTQSGFVIFIPASVQITLTDTGGSISDSISDTVVAPIVFTDTAGAISDTLSITASSGGTTVNINFQDTASQISDYLHVSGLGGLSSGQQNFFPMAPGGAVTLASQALSTNQQTFFPVKPGGNAAVPGPQVFYPFGPGVGGGSTTAPLTTPNQTIFPQKDNG